MKEHLRCPELHCTVCICNTCANVLNEDIINEVGPNIDDNSSVESIHTPSPSVSIGLHGESDDTIFSYDSLDSDEVSDLLNGNNKT